MNNRENILLKSDVITQNRLEWIDAFKGFAIFCITMCHLEGNYYFEKHLVSFNVLAFFFMSGFLHGENQGCFKNYFLKKTKTVLIPFLAWDVVSVAFDLIRGADFFSSIRLLLVLDGHVCWNSPIYFLLVLYITQLIYFFVRNFLPNEYIRLCLFPVLILILRFVTTEVIFLKLNLIPLSLAFYILGDFFVYFDSRVLNKVKGRLGLIFIPICCVLLALNIVYGVRFNTRISYTYARFGNFPHFIIGGIAGVLFYALVFKNLKFLTRSRVLAFWGKNTLVIMAGQFWLFRFFKTVMRFVPFGEYYYQRNAIMAFVMSVITVLILSAVAKGLMALGKKSSAVKWVCSVFGIR